MPSTGRLAFAEERHEHNGQLPNQWDIQVGPFLGGQHNVGNLCGQVAAALRLLV